MNTKKFLGFIFMFAIIIGTSISLSSCGDDDKEEIVIPQSKIVGKWEYNFGGGYSLFTFNSDGSGVYYEFDDGMIDADNIKFYYTYQEETCLLVIKWIKDGKLSYEEKTSIKWVNNNTFIATNLADPNSVWVRQ